MVSPDLPVLATLRDSMAEFCSANALRRLLAGTLYLDLLSARLVL
jgi:hypothetical protein